MHVVKKTLRMGAIWLILSVCLWTAGAACINYAVSDSSAVKVSLRFSPKSEPSFTGMKRYYEELTLRPDAEALPGLATAWAEVRNKQISSPEWNINVPVDVYHIDGNTEDVMSLRLTAGSFPERSDKQGVALDVKSAVKLFGSTSPVGLSVSYDGQEYIIRGIFKRPKGLITWGTDTGMGLAVFTAPIEVSGDKGMGSVGVQGVEVSLPAGMAPEEAENAAMQLTGRMGLSGAVYVKVQSNGDTMLRQMASLPGWVMMAVAMLMLLRTVYGQTRMMLRLAWRRGRSRTIPARKAQMTALRGLLTGFVLLASSLCIYFIVKPDFSLPPSYIPTQWSDTGFWPQLVKRTLQDIAERNMIPFARPDAMKRAMTGWGTLFVCASLISIYFVRISLQRVLGRPVAARLYRHRDEWTRPVASWDLSCYLLLLVAAVAPVLGFKLVEVLGLRPSISGAAFAIQALPAIMISVEMVLRLWPSALWPLRISWAAVHIKMPFMANVSIKKNNLER